MSRHRDQEARETALAGDPGGVEPPTNRAHSRFWISRTFLLPLPGLDYAPLSAQSKPIPAGSVAADKPFRSVSCRTVILGRGADLFCALDVDLLQLFLHCGQRTQQLRLYDGEQLF
jgi:hypothetical protein